MAQASYSKPTQREIDRAETDLLINLSTLTQRGLAKMIGCHESKIPEAEPDHQMRTGVIAAQQQHNPN